LSQPTNIAALKIINNIHFVILHLNSQNSVLQHRPQWTISILSIPNHPVFQRYGQACRPAIAQLLNLRLQPKNKGLFYDRKMIIFTRNAMSPAFASAFAFAGLTSPPATFYFIDRGSFGLAPFGC